MWAWRAPGPMLFVHRSYLFVTRMAERMVGRAPAELGYARGDGRPPLYCDFTIDRDDWRPGVVDGVLQVAMALRRAHVVLRSAAGGT